MVKSTFDKVEKIINRMLAYCHQEGLLGLNPHIRFRLAAANIELKYGTKQERHTVKDDKEMVKEVDEAFVKLGIELDKKIIEEIARGTKDLYLGAFNDLVFTQMEIKNIGIIASRIAHTTNLPREFRKQLLKALVGSLKNEYDFLRETQKQINSALAAYQGRTSVTNAFRSVLKTEGPSYFRRKNQQKNLKDGVKSVRKALGDAKMLEAGKVKDVKAAQDLSKELVQYLKIAEEDFKKTEQSIGMEWQEFGSLLNTVEKQIEATVEKHKLPKSTMDDSRRLLAKIANVIMYRYAESLHKAINQLDRQIEEAEKMLSKSLRRLFA